MVDYEVGLLINNSKEFDKVGGFFTVNAFRKCGALSLTIKNKSVNADRINEAISIINKNTSVFSNFRGNNLLVAATTISLEEDMKSALEEINSIYEKLKKEFFTSEYLILTAIVIFNSRDRINIDKAVSNTRIVYKHMAKEHRFLTGSEDTTAAAMIAVTSSNIEGTMKEVELYYEGLSDKGFWKGNNLQALSHILPLFSGDINSKIEKINLLNKALKANNVPIKSYSLPLLGVAAIVAEEPNAFAKLVSEVNDKIKKEKGFGNFSLGYEIRNMMAVGVVAASYIDRLSDNEKERLIDTTNNVALTIQIAIELAVAGAVAAAAAASASASN